MDSSGHTTHTANEKHINTQNNIIRIKKIPPNPLQDFPNQTKVNMMAQKLFPMLRRETNIGSLKPSQKKAFRHKRPSKPALLYHTTKAGLLGQSRHHHADTTATHQLSTAIGKLVTKAAISLPARHVLNAWSVSPLSKTLCPHKDLIAPVWGLLISTQEIFSVIPDHCILGHCRHKYQKLHF